MVFESSAVERRISIERIQIKTLKDVHLLGSFITRETFLLQQQKR